MVKVKICGLTRMSDIEAVNLARPDYIGFVFAESRREITPGRAAVLREKLDPGIVPVGVFVNEALDNILSLVQNGVICVVQLHGNEDADYIAWLKAMTDAPVIKAVPVLEEGDARKWRESPADYLLLDNKGGGTGESFDWSLIGEVGKPFFLAGGINDGNVREAVDVVRPYAVDVSSGAETGGVKDPDKILTIVRSVRNG